MLVLSRRPDERILLKVPGLDAEIEVTVVRVQGFTVQLGFTAPLNVAIRRAELLRGPASSVPFACPGESSMHTPESPMYTAQPGDRVQVHYVKRYQDGSVASSRRRDPLELTVGTDHPHRPGLGVARVGRARGTSATVSVPAGRAYGPPDPTRVQNWARTRFPEDQLLLPGTWVRIRTRQGQRRLVRILELRGDMVVVDTNRRCAGQALELEVELIGIHAPGAGSPVPDA
jgi:peptidylprolyl isomerase